MGKYFFLIFAFNLTLFSFGQNKDCCDTCTTIFDSISQRTVYITVDNMPKFPGGLDSLDFFLKDNFQKTPRVEADIVGSIYISFIIETDGSTTNKKLLKGLYKDYDEAALKIIDMMHRWKPGTCKGKSVPVKYVVPFRVYL